MYFQYSTSTTPSKEKKWGKKSLYLKIIFIQVSAVHGKEIVDDFAWIITEINIKNASVAIDWK